MCDGGRTTGVVDEMKSATGSGKQSHKDSDGRGELCLIRLHCLANVPMSLSLLRRPTYIWICVLTQSPTDFVMHMYTLCAL